MDPPQQEQLLVDPHAQARERAIAAATREIAEVEKMIADAVARLPGLHARLRAARMALEGGDGDA
jgi:hypothetical protein